MRGQDGDDRFDATPNMDGNDVSFTNTVAVQRLGKLLDALPQFAVGQTRTFEVTNRQIIWTRIALAHDASQGSRLRQHMLACTLFVDQLPNVWGKERLGYYVYSADWAVSN